MRVRTLEISVGAFVLAGALSLVFLAVKVSGVNFSSARDAYTVLARFDDVAGLRERAKVSMAGVTIGRVVKIEGNRATIRIWAPDPVKIISAQKDSSCVV